MFKGLCRNLRQWRETTHILSALRKMTDQMDPPQLCLHSNVNFTKMTDFVKEWSIFFPLTYLIKLFYICKILRFLMYTLGRC